MTDENDATFDLRHRLLIVLDNAVGQARLTRDEAMSLLDMFDRVMSPGGESRG